MIFRALGDVTTGTSSSKQHKRKINQCCRKNSASAVAMTSFAYRWMLIISIPVLPVVIHYCYSPENGFISGSMANASAWMTSTTMNGRWGWVQRRRPRRRRRRLLSLVSFATPIPSTQNQDDNNDNIENKNNIDSSLSSHSVSSLFQPSSTCKVDQMSGTDLAYIGDVVYELYIRTRTVWPLKRTTDLQQQVVALVRAEHQSKLLHKLRHNDTSSDFPLTIKEEQVMNRGRNAASSRSKNNINHRHHPMIYQDSTALEALIGYMYISDTKRCTELFHWIELNIDTL